jgi:hypothetical protein
MLIGQPKSVREFKPLDAGELQYIAGPLDNAVQQGMPMEGEAAVNLTVLCRLVSTVFAFAGRVVELEKELADLKQAPAPEAE